MHKKVYILGAGASKPDGVPLMNEFISEGTEKWDCEDDSETINDFFRFVKAVFPTHIAVNYISSNTPVPDQGMFEMAGYLDEEVGIEKVLSKAVELKDIAAGKAIKKFIFKTIESASNRSYVFDSKQPIKKQFTDCYHQFVLKKIKEDIKKNDIVFISFNYDRFLEGALLHYDLGDKFSYLVPPFENPDNRTNFDSYMRGYESKIKLLKLHGALNWIFCSNCNDIQLYWSKRYTEGDLCPKCKQNSSSPLLIPPVINKEYAKIIEPLWNKAEEYLREASEVIVIGYSFREADIKARNLVGNALKFNLNSFALTIVDKNSDKILKIILEISETDKNKFPPIKKISSFENFLNEQSYSNT